MGRSWLKLCGASLCVLGTALSLPLSAFQIKSDNTELSGYLDTTVTAGAGIRTSDRSKSNVGLFSGGTNPSTNGDNGNLNYDQWDFYSAALKTLHELELHYRRLTLFSRLSALYDTDVMDGSTRRTPLGNDAEHLQGRGIKLLDAYLSWDGELKGVEFTLRSGNQVLSWGESTFIQNGLNVINPVDVSKLRVAGAELKEALLPVPMIGLEVDLTQKFSLGAFYQVRWEETKIDPLGTFFSTNDAISPDAQFLMTDATVDDTVSCTSLSCPGGGSIGQSVRRGTDIDGSDSGNYGIVLRYFEPKLNDTEFGLYAMKYSSRLPVMSGFKGAKTMPGVLLAATYFPESYYFVEYPDDICMYGFSFNTTVESIAVQGEYSLKHDHPVQIDTSLLVPAIVGMTTLGAIPDETLIHGFRRKDISQAQLTLTWNAGRCLAAGCVVVVGEVGATYVHGLEFSR